MGQRVATKAAIFTVASALAALGVYNLIAKTSTPPWDDGVYWRDAGEGVVASRLVRRGPADRAGIHLGDVLLGLNGEGVVSGQQVEGFLAARTSTSEVRYSLLRAGEKRTLEVVLRPLPQGNVKLFFYLSLVGFFSLAVGTIVTLHRPSDRMALHFFSICLLFFLMYSTSYTGRFDGPDWLLFFVDRLAMALLPAAFLHLCLSFPERPASQRRTWLALAYGSGLALLVLGSGSQALMALGRAGLGLWPLAEALDRLQPLYFGGVFVASFAVLLQAYRSSARPGARRQLKWLVWGSGVAVLPFVSFYALPFALGSNPGAAMELAGYIPLALIPLSLAYAVLRHRLIDVELIFRRALVITVAGAAVLGISLLLVGLLQSLIASEDDPHTTLIALFTATVVLVLFTPLKARVQEGVERLVYRHRYAARKALRRLAVQLNADLDPGRVAQRLIEGVEAGLGLQTVAVFTSDGRGTFSILRSRGPLDTGAAYLRADGPLMARLALGHVVDVENEPTEFREAARLDLSHYLPCRVGGELIAVLAVGHKEGRGRINTEEQDVLETLAAQAATAFMNARLYQRLQEKADELEDVTEYNVNILESMDAGILVLDLEGRIARWNRAMEALDGRTRDEVLGRSLEEVFSKAFLDALQGSLVLGDQDDIAHIYKLHLPAASGRSLMVNVSVAPFQVDSGTRLGTVLILEDVTTRVRLEEQLLHSEKMASIGLLAAGVAHEVNTPLAGISSYTQMLRAQLGGDDPRGELLDKIEKQSFRAAKIVHNLLKFARTSGAEMEPLNLNRVIQDVLSLVEHQLEGAKIRVRREFETNLPDTRGNENRLQQVFFNLILNAQDAMPSGGWLTIRTAVEADAVLAEVADTGVGIRREDMKRIYDPFFTTKGIGRGTGLGLSVSYGIVQEHGGAISVESTPGQGTRFRLTLPIPTAREAVHR